jgi:outer membrane protein assembly factor BamB
VTPVFAVIPSAVVLGPLAVLAAVFPGAAAVLSVIAKRWWAFLAVVGIHSTFAAIVSLGRPGWKEIVRLGLPFVVIMGLIWAGIRYRRLVARDPVAGNVPSERSVRGLLGTTSILFLLVVGLICTFGTEGLTSTVGLPLVGTLTGLITASGYAAYRRFARPAGPMSLSEEFVALLALLVVSLIDLPHGDRTRPVESGTPIENSDSVDGPRLASGRVLFRTDEADEVMSAPVVDGKRVYFGTGKLAAFGSFGAVYAVDAETGAAVWRFDHGNRMRPAFATPTVANGLVYCGEGLHSDAGCSLFALKADTGTLAWSVPTSSHTECMAAVVGSRVYFGAGDDGLYCVDGGKPVWHRGGVPHKLHVDSPPAVAHGRVYAGSGYHTWAAFALDEKTGDELWRVPEALRAFGPPLVLGSRVAFGLGTGNLSSDFMHEPELDEPPERDPAGAVLCVDGATGKVVWRTSLPKSVHTTLAADAFRLYAACRDGCVYALDRRTGAVRWKRPIGTGLVTGVVLVPGIGLYAVTEEGLAACLDPHTGGIVWTKDLAMVAGGRVNVVSNPAVVPLDSVGAKRAVYVGGSVLDRRNGKMEAVLFRLDDVIADE